MDISQLLTDSGLSDKEALIYLAALELGSSTVLPLARKAGIKRTSVYNFIDKLVEAGLLTRALERGRSVYSAESPNRLFALQQERARKLEQALPELLSIYNRSSRKPRIRYFEGAEQMKNIVKEEPLCKTEALYVWPGKDIMDMIGGTKYMAEIDRNRIAAGVKIRTIRFRDKDVTFKTSSHGSKFLRELRFAPLGMNISMGLGIYDTGKVAFISSKYEGFGIVIESRELEILMRGLYEHFWHRCTSVGVGEG